MRHPTEERLAHLALTARRSRRARGVHLRRCAHCRSEVDDLRRVLGLARTPAGPTTVPARVWAAVTAELGFVYPPGTISNRPADPTYAIHQTHATYPSHPTHAGDPTDPTEPTGPARPTDAMVTSGAARRGRRSGRVGSRVLVAAVVGLVVGVLGTLTIAAVDDSRDGQRPQPTAAVRLAPLGDDWASGSAQVLRTNTGMRLRITSTGLKTFDGFYEVWLIHADGSRMVSIGVLDARGRGLLGVPAGAVANGYTTVDVSAEPGNGDPAHSRHSVIRGVLPS